MEARNLGGTGLKVSPLCLGMMSYGSPSWQPWVLEKSAARSFVKQALDSGLNFFDTSDFYSYGDSEEALGEAIRGTVPRDELVISTKVGMPMGKAPTVQGNSRKRIRDGVDASLKRLGVDYIDLYLLHKWDDDTPIEESIESLDDLVRAGKILYRGVSNFRTFQLAAAQNYAMREGRNGLSAMQLQYNLVYREEERENLPFCRHNGIGVMVYSPLARGWLIGGDNEDPAELTERERTRVEQDAKGQALYGKGGDTLVRQRLHEMARRLGLPPGRVAMAWILARPGISTILVGALEPHHLSEAVAALAVNLTAEDIAYLEEPYVPGVLRTAGFKEVMAQQARAASQEAK